MEHRQSDKKETNISELLNRSPQRFHCLPAYPPTFTIFNSYEHGVMVQLDDGGVDVLCQSH